MDWAVMNPRFMGPPAPCSDGLSKYIMSDKVGILLAGRVLWIRILDTNRAVFIDYWR